MRELNTLEKGDLCQNAIELFYGTSGGLVSFPGILKNIIRYKAWEERVTRGKVVKLNSLAELITLPPVDGWGETLKSVENVLRDDEDALAMFREATTSKRGGANNPHGIGGKSGKRLDDIVKNNNVIIDNKADQGNSAAYTAQRLSEQFPEAYKDYKDGKHKSLNQAAIAVGIRKPTLTISADPMKAAKTIKKRFEKTEIDILVACLRGEL